MTIHQKKKIKEAKHMTTHSCKYIEVYLIQTNVYNITCINSHLETLR